VRYKDYYATLGVARGTPADEIRRAYRRLAQKYHPDRNHAPDAEARFKEINEAWEVLGNPDKRARYDRMGAGLHAGDDVQAPPGAGFRDVFSDERVAGFSDFFRTFFGEDSWGWKAGSAPRARGRDQQARVEISIEDACAGQLRELRFNVPEVGSDGVVRDTPRMLKVRIPPGIQPGQKIRLAGQGAPGTGGGEPGDLYLEIAFAPHPRYRIEGRDLVAVLPVTPWEAALGEKVPVATPGGKIELRIPPGSQSGRRLRVKGRGLPGTPAGDFHVILQIHTPPARTPEARDFYREMAASLRFDPRASDGEG
jgi:curved DNA-binding protein